MSFVVYRHYDREGRLLYVGCTSNPTKREVSRRAAGCSWIDEIASTTHVNYSDRPTALAAERHAIESERPIHNVRYLAPAPPRPPSRAVEVHGYALREIRELRSRKVADLAEALGVDRSYITHIENGSKRRVSPEFYNALCAELLIRDQRVLLATAPAREAIPA